MLNISDNCYIAFISLQGFRAQTFKCHKGHVAGENVLTGVDDLSPQGNVTSEEYKCVNWQWNICTLSKKAKNEEYKCVNWGWMVCTVNKIGKRVESKCIDWVLL